MQRGGKGVMGSEDQRLMQRIESLEEEVEEQRLLLRYAIKHLESTGDQGACNPAEEAAGEQKVETGQAKNDPKGSNVLSRATTTRGSAGSSAGQGASGETAPKSGEGSFGALAELLRLRGWEWWLNKTGIGLLLFGVVFLFKFSVDRGWLTPEVRVGCGLALGAGLVWFGLRVYEERRAFSQVMLGGGIGTFYITGFAAFQLYALVPYAPAFAFLVAVTLLAFALSVRQDEVALAMIGAAGGFGTPFLLYSGAGSLGGFVLYTALILAGIAAIYAYKGWRSLLLVSAAGVFGALSAGYSQATGPVIEAGRVALQAGVLFAVLVLWLVPVAREVLRRRRPGRWPVPDPGGLARSFFSGAERALHPGLPAHLLSAVLPLAGLAFTQEIWGLSKEPLGWISAGAAVAYAVVAGTLRRAEGGGFLYYTNALSALVLSTLGILLLLEGNALFFALAVEAAMLHLASRRLSDRVVSALAHGLFLTVGLWLFGRILVGVEETFYLRGREPGVPERRGVAGPLRHSPRLRGLGGYRGAGYSTCLSGGGPRRAARPALPRAYRSTWGRHPGFPLLGRLRLGVAPALTTIPAVGHGGRGAHGLGDSWPLARRASGVGYGLDRVPLFDLPAVADLGVVCLALLTSTLLPGSTSAVVYRLVVHAAVLAWLWRELGAFPDGTAYVTVSWSVYAAGLLVLGLRRASPGLVRLGVFTLFLVVGKLFLVDLVWVDAVWRILLFLGAGGLFLVLGYYLQTLWKTGAGSPGQPS